MGVGWVKKKKKNQLFTAGGCNASRAVGSERLEILHSLPFQVDTGAPSHKSTEGSSHKSTRLSRSWAPRLSRQHALPYAVSIALTDFPANESHDTPSQKRRRLFSTSPPCSRARTVAHLGVAPPPPCFLRINYKWFVTFLSQSVSS